MGDYDKLIQAMEAALNPPQTQYDHMAEINTVQADPNAYAISVLGYEEVPEFVDDGDTGWINFRQLQLTEREIWEKDVIENLPNEVDVDSQTRLALEMFLKVDGAYGSSEDVFDEDGSVNQESFLIALERTLTFARTAGPQGLDTTTKYLDILLNAGSGEGGEAGGDLQSMLSEFEKRKSESGSNSINPNVMKRLMETEFESVLGRGATLKEQRKFVNMMLEFGDSLTLTDVQAEAGVFARNENPAEATGMDHVGAAAAVMRVLPGLTSGL